MFSFITIEDAAKAIDAAGGRTGLSVSWFSRDINREVFGRTHEQLLLAVFKCELPSHNPLSGERVLPTESDARIWTSAQALKIWLARRGNDYRFTESVALPAQSHALPDATAGGNAITPRKRRTNLRKAIDAAVVELGKKPSLEELWAFFQGDRDTTGHITDYTDTHVTWTDTKGVLHDTQKETLANQLSRVSV